MSARTLIEAAVEPWGAVGYRAYNYNPPRHATVADIVAYEAKELGNADIREQAEAAAARLGLDLATLRARDAVWVTRTREQAQAYGSDEDVRAVDLSGSLLLVDLGEEGGLWVRVSPVRSARNIIEAASQNLLVVVHPGSLCGSADMNLGKDRGRYTRESIAGEISRWPGQVAVVTGDLDDELKLPKYAPLNQALSRATYAVYGEPTAAGLEGAAQQIARHFKLRAPAQVVVTGAWHDNDGSGCVTAVHAALKKLKLDAKISLNAPASDDYEDEEEEESR